MPEAQHVDLDDFVARLSGETDLIGKQGVFFRSLQTCGVEYFSYHVLKAGGSTGRLPFVITNYPTSWLDHYKSSGYLDEDPVVSETMRRRTPFLWSEVLHPGELSRQQRDLMQQASDVGLRDGLTIPLTGAGSDMAAVSVVPGTSADAAGQLARHRHVVHLLAMYFHEAAATSLIDQSMVSGSSRRQSLLSPREKEVLEWTARGKSVWETASILKLSEKSVEFHTDGAKRKLQVFNRTHAVVKALMIGLIKV